MTFLRELVNTGVDFAHDPIVRRSILLSNVVSLILFGLGTTLFGAYFWWYGWSVVTMAIPIVALLCLCTLFLNKKNLSSISRIWLTLVVPLATMSLSVYAKLLYTTTQEELDYFTFRFIILASCVFPAIFFGFKEKTLLLTTSLLTLGVLMLHDPIHEFFGVPYRQHVLKETNYSFTNVVILITYGIMMGAVIFLKWVSESSEHKANTLVKELNRTNEQLKEKNEEIEAQNLEISAQTENLNTHQQRLQEAYELIAQQKNLLVHQNKNLSSELVDTNKDLTETNAELIKHNNELRQFSYTVSHNLRGPLASLIGLIGLLDERNFNDSNREIVGHIQTSVKRLDTIIADLNKIIDIRHEIFHIREKINLQSEVDKIRLVLEKDLNALKVMIKTDFSRCPEIYSVRPMVHSILYNLISNAIKYRHPDRAPEIRITSSFTHHYIIQVKDNGLGIDLTTHKPSLFKLYKRFHNHTEGKGLGLYLVKLQSEALGGFVDVHSNVNQGTDFTVHLGQPENVERQILFDEPHAQIFFDAKLDTTGVIWKGPITSHEYRSVFVKCLDFVKVYNTPNYLADLSEQGPVAIEDQQWMFREILPQAAYHGLKKIAAITPVEPGSDVVDYLTKINEGLLKMGIKQMYFSSITDATAWIKQEAGTVTTQSTL